KCRNAEVCVPSETVICPLGLVCTDDISVDCEGKNGAFVDYSDPVPTGGTESYTVVCSPVSGSLFAPGVTTVNCNVTDASDPQQSADCHFTVTVPDSCPGTCAFTCGLDVPGGCGNSLVGGVCGRAVTYISPDCPGSTVDCQPASGTFFPVAITTVTCTATDPTDGTQTCTFKVTVTNPGTPSLTGCPSGDSTVQCYGGVPAAPT